MQMPGNYPANYCMPMLGTVNNLGMYGGNIPMGVNNYVQHTPAVSTASTPDDSKEPNRDSVSTSPQLPKPSRIVHQKVGMRGRSILKSLQEKEIVLISVRRMKALMSEGLLRERSQWCSQDTFSP